MADSPAQVIPVRLPNGSIMYAEATQIGPTVLRDEDRSKGGIRLGFPTAESALPAYAEREPPLDPQDISAVMGTIEGIAQAVAKTAESSNAFEINVEFGLELAVENGTLTTLFVKGSGKANLKVALKWSRQAKTSEGQPGG
jgi:hypothetical protein